jgi:uncharacterized membrane-anchored protein YitT (DUF2179 family)
MTYPCDDAFNSGISYAALRFATGAGHTRRALYPKGTGTRNDVKCDTTSLPPIFYFLIPPQLILKKNLSLHFIIAFSTKNRNNYYTKKKIYLKCKELDWKKHSYEYLMILIGSFIMAAAFVIFISPFRLAPGGVYGIAITLHYLTGGLPIGIYALCFDIPLFLIGTWILGPKFGAKTLVGIFSLSGFTTLLEKLYGYEPLVTDDYFLAAVFGGLLLGIGLGLIFKSRATSGGTDIVAMIINKYNKIPVGRLLIYIDTVVVLVGLVAFKDWRIPLYSWVTIFITGKIIDIMIEGIHSDKAVYIISAHYNEIRDKIIHEMNRGGTYLRGEGMFNGAEKKIIYTIVDRKELILLQRYVHEIDPDAFITVVDSTETLGEGFHSLKEKINS